MLKMEEQILIANELLSRLSPLKIRILEHLLRLCPIIGYGDDNGKPIRKPCKISTRELCNILKACRPIVYRELRELEEEDFIHRKHRIGKTKEIYILDFPAD